MYRFSMSFGRLLLFAFYYISFSCVFQVMGTSAFLVNIASFRKSTINQNSILKFENIDVKKHVFGNGKKVIRFNGDDTKQSPLAGRTVQLIENEDDTERVSKITFKTDGSLCLKGEYDSTNAKEITGSWKDRGENKIAFLLNRHYKTDTIGNLKEERTYTLERIYEGTYHPSKELSSIRGEGKIEQEKYSDIFACGIFSFVTEDDDDDDGLFKKTTSGEIHHSDPIGTEFD